MSDSFANRNPENEEWLLAKAETESGPLFIRLNTTAREYAGDPTLNIKLGFAIPLLKQTGTGMPDPDENDALASVEDLICDTVEQGATGIHVLTLTNAVIKELVFYIAEGADIAAMHNFLMSNVQSHEVQCIAARDPDWEMYLEFSPE